jgi:hypothetical protein
LWFSFKIYINKIINKSKQLFPFEFKDIDIIIEFGEEKLDSEIEFEGWMSEPFIIKEEYVENEIILEDWMLKPFFI